MGFSFLRKRILSNSYFPDYYHVKTNTSRVEIGSAKLLKWLNALFEQRSEIEALQKRGPVFFTIESVIFIDCVWFKYSEN